MEERLALFGVLLIMAISISTYLIVAQGNTGLAFEQTYQSCCCNILTQTKDQFLIRSQIQTFAPNCTAACSSYNVSGKVFPQQGLCSNNP